MGDPKGEKLLQREVGGATGVYVERSRLIHAAPAEIFAWLADVDNLARILPRVTRIEVLARNSDSATVRTHMAVGPFGTICSEGQVRWLTDRELSFQARRPVAISTRWTLTPAEQNTQLHTAMELDLAPLMGPLAAFVPAESVAALVGPDMDATLSAIAEQLERR